jgi:hypothetical protein
MSTQITNYRQRVDGIASLILKGIECWYDAGRALCDLIDEDPSVIDKICADIPALSPNVLRQLERIGRKQLMPSLLLKNGPGWNKLRAMPFDVQEKYSDTPVELVIITEKGHDTLKVKVEDLSAAQVRQVFKDDCIRDVSAQRAWLAENQPMKPKHVIEQPYTIHGKFVDFSECRLSLQQLLTIAAQMKAT